MVARVHQKILRVKRFGSAIQVSKPVGRVPGTDYRRVGAKRQPVKMFTFSSMRRARIHMELYGDRYTHVIDLTYPGDWVTTDVRIEQNHLKKFLQKMLRLGVQDYFWAKEYQERGVIHWHILVDRFIHKDRIKAMWAEIIGEAARTNIDKIRSKKGMAQYVMAYWTKKEQKTIPEGVTGHGRWWGSNNAIKPTDEVSLRFQSRKEAAFIMRHVDNYYGRLLKEWGKRSGRIYKRPARRQGFTVIGAGDRVEKVFLRLVTGYGSPEIIL